MPLFTLAIRTSCGGSTGMGHLKRLTALAQALQQYCIEPLFIINTPLQLTELPSYFNFTALTLIHSENNLLEDADNTLHIVRRYPSIKAIMVDDYQLGSAWEEVFQQQGYRIIVIDDLVRQHQCDLLIDSKWRGAETALSYDHCLPASTQTLLGPDYFILSREYQAALPERKASLAPNPFTILISLGGSPRLDQIEQLTDAFSHYWSLTTHLQLNIVSGNLPRQKIQSGHSRVTIDTIENVPSLYPCYLKSDLFVGAAGTSMYEAFACQLPAITFTIADNQHIPLSHVHDFGHFFHSNSPPWDWLEGLVRSCEQFCQNYSKLEQSYRNARCSIDGKGSDRISLAIKQLLSPAST
ncbi:hypothetical protein D5085_06410 [Ectothiorhodospiraceae bacterium BW-2]|nr:hypothetical protein D5085_06410 [Ectothiorhodospiraceae bacterium BW-2]